MLSTEENEVSTRIGPATPAGAMLRRYWWPVGFTEHVEIKGSPVRTQLLAKSSYYFATAAPSSAWSICTARTAARR